MPNHCANRLTLIGPDEDIDAFLKEFSVSENDCYGEECTIYIHLQDFKDDILAVYKELNGKDMPQIRSLDTPYGTKWGCYEFDEPIRWRQSVTLTFKTAWCPYNVWTSLFLSRKYPRIHFALLYAECGVCFVGTRVAKGGVILEEWCEMVFDTGKVKLVEYDEDDDDDGYIDQRWVWKPGYDEFHELWNRSG